MRAHFEREAAYESSWTTYNASLGRTLLNTSKFLKREDAVAVAAAAAAAVETTPAQSPAAESFDTPASERACPLPLAEEKV